ncbi:hypothetical protein PAMC26577_09730 [Caballeronia sordidicola]|uniref:Uncharacterized protein n=1 Tax=Caballeronia sordidicola TaxID=196367 RepID=A0A242N0M8_CABSO|nr:hypothetical protein PAMC26577_09730 [Caballeronia sordidicola]
MQHSERRNPRAALLGLGKHGLLRRVYVQTLGSRKSSTINCFRLFLRGMVYQHFCQPYGCTAS